MADLEIMDDQENDEISHPWEVTQSNLPDAEKKVVYRELFVYKQSDEYKALEKYCEEMVEKQEAICKDIAFTRSKTENTKSIVDEYVSLYKVFSEISDKITNEVFKQYFTEYRMTALESAIVRKKGIVDRNGSTVPLDMPIYTDLDIAKEKTAGYFSFPQYIEYCLSLFDTKKKEVVDENPHQPY